MEKDKASPIELALSEPLPANIDIGMPFTLALALETGSGCNLAGATYQVVEREAVIAAGILPTTTRLDPDSDDHDPRNGPLDLRDTARIALVAPSEIGTFQWTIVLPQQDIGGVLHAHASLAFSFKTDAHRTSLAVWDLPSSVVAGEKFVFKVGAKCGACCVLAGCQVALRSDDGSLLATGTLRETWRDTEGLYWTMLEATAPRFEGLVEWSVAFAPSHRLAHRGASASLSFMTVPPGRHQVAVAIVEKGSAIPVGDAQVRLGYHRCATDATGIARFLVTPGKHRLFVWKATHAVPETIVEVARDLDLVVEAEVLPGEDPYARWQG